MGLDNNDKTASGLKPSNNTSPISPLELSLNNDNTPTQSPQTPLHHSKDADSQPYKTPTTSSPWSLVFYPAWSLR
jgi:hypothetical protein